MPFTVIKRGPIFDGRMHREVRKTLAEGQVQVGEMGVNIIRAELHQVLRHPTGYYESQIQTDRAATELHITDGGVIYGPWLEGTSSRNVTTRFKGYATFRRMTQVIQGKANTLMSAMMSATVRRLS